MKVAAASTIIPVMNAAMQEYAKISLKTLAIASPVRHPLFAPMVTAAPWRKGEISSN
jgi:hypothetical protein